MFCADALLDSNDDLWDRTDALLDSNDALWDRTGACTHLVRTAYVALLRALLACVHLHV